MKSLKKILFSEGQKLNGFVYSTWPYPCGLSEAMIHAGSLILAHEPEIKREETKIEITLQGRQGTRARPRMITLRTT